MPKPLDCGRWKSHGEPMTIAEQVRHARKKAEMSQRLAATATGVSYVHISNIENGHVPNVSVGVLAKLAKGFNVRFAVWPESKPNA